MSAVETLRRHNFGKPDDLGPPALERAAHQLMIDEANRRIAAEKRIEELRSQLATQEKKIETATMERDAANEKVRELISDLAKRSEGYRAGLAGLETKLSQEREGRHTADTLAAQARAEADVANAEVGAIGKRMQELSDKLDALAEMKRAEVVDDNKEDVPISYRIQHLQRDGAGDLRTFDLVPIERK